MKNLECRKFSRLGSTYASHLNRAMNQALLKRTMWHLNINNASMRHTFKNSNYNSVSFDPLSARECTPMNKLLLICLWHLSSKYVVNHLLKRCIPFISSINHVSVGVTKSQTNYVTWELWKQCCQNYPKFQKMFRCPWQPEQHRQNAVDLVYREVAHGKWTPLAL